jgi:hypothetical protein
VRGSAVLLPNLVPHLVSLHITVLVFSKNEVAVILFLAVIMICSIILVSIYSLIVLNITIIDAI